MFLCGQGQSTDHKTPKHNQQTSRKLLSNDRLAFEIASWGLGMLALGGGGVTGVYVCVRVGGGGKRWGQGVQGMSVGLRRLYESGFKSTGGGG